jgi:hypothetical protein
MRFVNNEVRMLMNETNNQHNQKDKFGFVKDIKHKHQMNIHWCQKIVLI